MADKCKQLFAASVILLAGFVTAAAQDISFVREGILVGEALSYLGSRYKITVVLEAGAADVDQIVNVNLHDATVQETMTQLFAGQDVSFSIDGRRVIVTKKSSDGGVLLKSRERSSTLPVNL